MRRFLIVWISLLLLVLSVGRATAAPASTSIDARFQPDGALMVEYRFDRPVERLVFAYGAASFRQRRWQVVANLAVWNDQGELVGCDGPLDQVSIRIVPGWDRTDRTFSDLIPMGQGTGMFYPAWLLPGETAVARSVRLEAAPGLSLLDRNRHWASAIQWSATDIEGRALYAWLYTGPEKPLRADGLTVIAGSDLAADQVETVARAADAALARYTALLEQGPPDQPVVLLTGRADERTATNGSVGPGGLISLMLRWDAAGLPPDRVGRTVWHEMFHLWNRQDRPGSPPWLHEGAAEVAALLRHGDDPAMGRVALAEALSDCLALLPPGEGVGGPTARRGQGPYRCGLALNLIIAAGLAPDGNWAAGFGRLWRHLLAVPGGYGLDDALALAARQSPAAMLALDRLLTGGGGAGDLPALLAPLGIRLEPASASADLLRDRLAQHLLALNCGPGLRGFYRQPDGLRFDGSHAACGPLVTDPLVTRVEGFDLMQAAPTAFQAATTRCATGQPVRMEGPAGPLSVPCARSIPAPPSRFVVTGK
jgi:hypothetical protein